MKSYVCCMVAIALVAAGCASGSHREDDSNPRPPPVVIHSDIDQSVSVLSHAQTRLEDGRLSVRVLLQSDKDKDLAVIVQTNWFDERGMVIEAGQTRAIVLPSESPTLIEDSSMGKEAAASTLSVRPASTYRR